MNVSTSDLSYQRLMVCHDCETSPLYDLYEFAGLNGILRTRINGDGIVHIDPTNGPSLILIYSLDFTLFSSFLFPQWKKKLVAKGAVARDLSRHGTWLLQNLKVSRNGPLLQLFRAFVYLWQAYSSHILPLLGSWSERVCGAAQ